MGREEQGLAKSRTRYHVIARTLCFITHGDRVLLLRGGPHKRLWAGRYNGVGGHVERSEDIYSAALREVREETGLEVSGLRLCGVVHADAGDELAGVLFFVFTATAECCEDLTSPDGTLEWHPATRLPYENAADDLPALLSRVLAMGPGDPPFFAHYSYDDQDRLVISFAQP